MIDAKCNLSFHIQRGNENAREIEGPVLIVLINEGGGIHKPEEERLQSLVVLPEPRTLNVHLWRESGMCVYICLCDTRH